MSRLRPSDVLVSLIGTTIDQPISGSQITENLSSVGIRCEPSVLLTHLIAMEASGLVSIDRGDSYRFWLSAEGERLAYEAAGGRSVHSVLVMADLVGYTDFTEKHDDAAASTLAQSIENSCRRETSIVGGQFIKALGDGVFTALKPGTDVILFMQNIKTTLQESDLPSNIRAAAHEGHPTVFRGDYYGSDVNLTARLCEIAEPNQLVVTCDNEIECAESVNLKGFARAWSIKRYEL